MKVAYKSNIDAYKGAFTDHDTVNGVYPQEGNYRAVTNGLGKRFTDQGLPPQLEVKRVTIHDTWIEVDLHYSEIQARAINLNKH